MADTTEQILAALSAGGVGALGGLQAGAQARRQGQQDLTRALQFGTQTDVGTVAASRTAKQRAATKAAGKLQPIDFRKAVKDLRGTQEDFLSLGTDFTKAASFKKASGLTDEEFNSAQQEARVKGGEFDRLSKMASVLFNTTNQITDPKARRNISTILNEAFNDVDEKFKITLSQAAANNPILARQEISERRKDFIKEIREGVESQNIPADQKSALITGLEFMIDFKGLEAIPPPGPTGQRLAEGRIQDIEPEQASKAVRALSRGKKNLTPEQILNDPEFLNLAVSASVTKSQGTISTFLRKVTGFFRGPEAAERITQADVRPVIMDALDAAGKFEGLSRNNIEQLIGTNLLNVSEERQKIQIGNLKDEEIKIAKTIVAANRQIRAAGVERLGQLEEATVQQQEELALAAADPGRVPGLVEGPEGVSELALEFSDGTPGAPVLEVPPGQEGLPPLPEGVPALELPPGGPESAFAAPEDEPIPLEDIPQLQTDVSEVLIEGVQGAQSADEVFDRATSALSFMADKMVEAGSDTATVQSNTQQILEQALFASGVVSQSEFEDPASITDPVRSQEVRDMKSRVRNTVGNIVAPSLETLPTGIPALDLPGAPVTGVSRDVSRARTAAEQELRPAEAPAVNAKVAVISRGLIAGERVSADIQGFLEDLTEVVFAPEDRDEVAAALGVG